jgi:hypothetical protein
VQIAHLCVCVRVVFVCAASRPARMSVTRSTRRITGFDQVPDEVAKYLLSWTITNIYEIPLWMSFGRRWRSLLLDARISLIITRLPHSPSKAFFAGIHRLMTQLKGVTELHLGVNRYISHHHDMHIYAS